MTHTAIGIFQGDADWNISVRAGGFASKEAAERYAKSFRIRLIDGRLYRDHADGFSPEDKPWIEVADTEVSLSRLKPESDDDYEPVSLPIAQWHQEVGLTCGFGSLAYSVD